MLDIREATNDEVMEMIKEARSAFEEGAVTFLLLLRDVELKREDVWKSAGILSFDMFLNTYHLINSSRYREFVAGYEKLGDPDLAFRLCEGVVAEISKLDDPTPEKIEQMAAWTEDFKEVNHVAPSQQTAREWRRRLEPKQPRVVHFRSELHKLRAEVQDLRAKLRERDRRIAELEAITPSGDPSGGKKKKSSKKVQVD